MGYRISAPVPALVAERRLLSEVEVSRSAGAGTAAEIPHPISEITWLLLPQKKFEHFPRQY